MIVATNTIRIKSGHADEVAERFKNPRGVAQAPGFIRMELLKASLEEHDELKVCTTWESKEAFDAWVQSDAFKAAHSHARPSGASEAEGRPSHPEGGQPEGGTSHGEAPRHGPGGGIMLGAKLSVHEVVFQTS